MHHRVFLSLLFLAATATAHADGIDNYIKAEMHQRHIPGLSLAVVRDGKIVKIKGYGLANIETGTLATPDTAFKIASISKQFLATGILLLASDGKLSLEDKASKFIEGTPESWKDITVRHLITHTSGLVEDPPGFEPFQTVPDAEIIRRSYATPLLSAPGEKWRYSNLSYFVLGEIIRKVTGKPWSQYLTERLFTPTGMTATRTTTTTDIVPNRAEGYNWSRGQWVKEPDWVAVRPSGAFLSTVRDMAKWDIALSSSTLVTPTQRAQLWAPTRLTDGTLHPYGLGWFLNDWQGHPRVHHQGGLPGFVSDIDRFTDDKLTVIVLTNTVSADPQKIALTVAGFYNPALAPKAAPALTDTEPEITAKFKAMINGLVRGNLDTGLFSPALAAQITPEMKARIAADLRYAGVIRSITLIGRKEMGENRQYHYRLNYRNYMFLVQATFDKQGKIVNLDTPRE